MIILTDCAVFDGVSEKIIEASNVVVEGNRILSVGGREMIPASAKQIDCGGRILMPGLIDAHIHAYSPSLNYYANDQMPASLLASHAGFTLAGMLQRGFTSVRDAGGGDVGLAQSIDQGLISGPRFFYSGKALSQTGGHGDMRPGNTFDICNCQSYSGSVSRVVDGVDEMRKAVREELRQGAHQIKLFVSGGVTSPTDPIWMNQFTDEEIQVAVYEANTRHRYVMAHCHTDEAVRRCVAFGVRTIEHGTDISAETAELIAEAGAYVVPTLSIVDVALANKSKLDLCDDNLKKLEGIYEKMLVSIEICQKAGVRLGLGSDIQGREFHRKQGSELRLRGSIEKAVDVLRSATSINAEILQMEGELGCIRAGALADILVLDFNPFDDLSGFENPQKNIAIIMKDGKFIRNSLKEF